ncbi:GntR family transcriptional regulator [Brachybacterium fresconis]
MTRTELWCTCIYMSKHPARGKRERIVATLSERIYDGRYAPGARLAGENELAREFGVSRGTIRQALADLQRQRLIATRSGLGSFVSFDGHRLGRGWARSMTEAGLDVSTRVLGIEPVERSMVPELPTEVSLDQGIAVRRVRSVLEDGRPCPISFECSTVPAVAGLVDLPGQGLPEGSLANALADAGLISDHGTQQVDVRPLDAREASILGRDVGTSFLRSVRTSFDVTGTFVEHVISLLDPRHFRLTLTFGENS